MEHFHRMRPNSSELEIEFSGDPLDFKYMNILLPYYIELKLAIPKENLIIKYRNGKYKVYINISGRIEPVYTLNPLNAYQFKSYIPACGIAGILDQIEEIDGLKVLPVSKLTKETISECISSI